MATPTPEQIAEVKGYLPTESEERYGWDDDKIVSVMEETDNSLPQTVRRFWYERWSETFEFTDISEASSTRNLSKIHENAKAMLDYWDAQVAAEGVVSSRKPITFGVIERPYE